MQGFDILSNLYSSDLTFLGLPDGLSDILVPSHSWTALFWVALCSWFLGILFAFISVTVQKSDVKFWTNLMTQIGFFFGMSHLYLLREDLGLLIVPLPRIYDLVVRFQLLSEVCRRLQRLPQSSKYTSPSTVRATWVCIHS